MSSKTDSKNEKELGKQENALKKDMKAKYVEMFGEGAGEIVEKIVEKEVEKVVEVEVEKIVEKDNPKLLDEIKRLNEVVDDKDARIEKCELTIKEIGTTMTDLGEQIDKLKKENKTLKSQNTKLKNALIEPEEEPEKEEKDE